jgi:hypothetical protein
MIVDSKYNNGKFSFYSFSIVTEQNDEKVSLSCERALTIQSINHVNEV